MFRGGQSLFVGLDRLQSAAIHAVSVIVLQGAGLSCLPCIGKDQIKSVPSKKTSVRLSPLPLRARPRQLVSEVGLAERRH